MRRAWCSSSVNALPRLRSGMCSRSAPTNAAGTVSDIDAVLVTTVTANGGAGLLAERVRAMVSCNSSRCLTELCRSPCDDAMSRYRNSQGECARNDHEGEHPMATTVADQMVETLAA